MHEYMMQRAKEEGEYIASYGATVRETAKVFHAGKSTVHKDVTERLPLIDKDLFERVRKVLDVNLSERHIRGGNATKHKFEKISVDKENA